jgi:hypothetical protein
LLQAIHDSSVEGLALSYHAGRYEDLSELGCSCFCLTAKLRWPQTSPTRAAFLQGSGNGVITHM